MFGIIDALQRYNPIVARVSRNYANATSISGVAVPCPSEARLFTVNLRSIGRLIPSDGAMGMRSYDDACGGISVLICGLSSPMTVSNDGRPGTNGPSHWSQVFST